MYKEISELRPYFHSLREFNADVSLDVKLPVLWDEKPNQKDFPNVRFKEQDGNDKTKLMSYVSSKNEAGYRDIFKCVKSIITFNLERERKERLLEEKINELKKLFKEKDLNLLENLKFEQLYEHKTGEGIELSDSEGFGENSIGDSEPQEEND